MAERRVVAQLDGVVAFDPEAFADGGEHLGLLDRVDAEVGFEVELEVEHVGRVAGRVGHQGDDLGCDIAPTLDGRCSGCGLGFGFGGRLGRRAGLARRCAVVDEGDDVAERRVVAQLDGVVAFDPEAFADGGEHLGLLDRVDAEVGFEVEIDVEHVGRVAGRVGHQGDDLGGDIAPLAGRARARLGVRVRVRRRRLGGSAPAAECAVVDEGDDVAEGAGSRAA